jgi:RecJ-like exonuclease
MIVGRGGHVKLEAGELKVQLRRFINSEIDYAARHISPIKQIYRKNRFISEGEQANRLILPILIF